MARFGERHGGLLAPEPPAAADQGWRLTGGDGSSAVLESWSPGAPDDPLDPLAWATPPALLTVLVRRGGYAVAVSGSDGQLLAHKVGTRHVQSRTAAGGWSQQRYARRRGHQADALVEAVAGHAVRVLGEGESRPGSGRVGGLVLGGDRTLAAAVVAALPARMRTRLEALPSRTLWNLPDPRRAVLDQAVRHARAVRVQVHDADVGGAV